MYCEGRQVNRLGHKTREAGGIGDEAYDAVDGRRSGPARSSFHFCQRPVQRSVFDGGAGFGDIEDALGLTVAVGNVPRIAAFRGIINLRRCDGQRGCYYRQGHIIRRSTGRGKGVGWGEMRSRI